MSSEIKVTNIKHDSSSSNNLVLASDGTTTVSNMSYPRYVIVKSSADITGASDRALSYSTSWTDHMYTGNFTTQKEGDIEAYFSAGHGHESGPARLQVLWELRNSSGTDVSATYWKTSGGSAPIITSYGGQTHGRVQNCFKQGHADNMAHGTNNNHIIFPSVAVGTYNLYVRVANNYGSSTATMNSFVNEEDILTVYHY